MYNCGEFDLWPEVTRMLAELTSYSFSGHETFSFRYPWLKKGYDAVRQDPLIFHRDDAITILGVGKNMVRSIRHWCLATGLIEEAREEGDKRTGALRPTDLGDWLFDDGKGIDPYLEDPATLRESHVAYPAFRMGQGSGTVRGYCFRGAYRATRQAPVSCYLVGWH